MAVSTLNSAALAALESGIAQALSMDPATARDIAGMAGTVVHLHCLTPAFDVYLLPNAEGLRLQASYEGDADCRISGAASEFLELLSAADKPGALINGELTVSGDTTPLFALQEALARLEIDWEGRLSTFIGDIPAHQLGRAMRGSARWSRSAAGSLLRHVEEFIHEEARLAPPRAEVEDFFGDLQQLDMRLQRLQARLRRQKRRAMQQGS